MYRPRLPFDYHSFSLEGFDPDQLLGVIRDSRFEQRLLRGGGFRVFHQRLVFGDCSLDSGCYSLPIVAQGAFGRQHLTFGIMMASDQPTFINGHAAARLDIQVHPPGGELFCRPAAGDWTWAAFLVPLEAFSAAAERLLGAPLAIPLDRMSNVRPAAVQGEALRRAVLEAFWAGVCAQGTPMAELASIDVQEQLLEALLRALASADASATDRHRVRADRWVRTLRRAEAFLREHAHEPYTSEALCRYINGSERTLEYAFKSAYGLAPREWHAVMRLNLARRELIALGPGDARVADVAMRWGFYHLGRFSTRYRELFNEPPAATLRQYRLR
jgi:AraC-like DNA-binding protein